MGQRILVVDDEQEILDATSSVLRKRGFDVSTSLNGVTALQKIREQKPDLILADVLMPEMDGYTFYKELKNSPATSDIPVLIVTGRGKMEDTFKVIGVDGFITKPFTPQSLMDEIEHIFLMHQNRRKPEGEGPAGIPKKILGVSPRAEALSDMAEQAGRAGYVFESAKTGSEALAKILKIYPDVIFLDVLTEEVPCAELAGILRRLPQFGDKPIIGFCDYSAVDLGSVPARQKILKIHDLSKQFLSAGGTEYMGKYHYQLFIKTAVEHLRPKKTP
ncbi:MAG: response regulator [Candidatus Omnitrophota bacterium]|nr:response regulator [Candidatus Omnitrophota bacterium]MDZ4242454.1 response regulator [Candidatus Omnitrophota bacterium]